MPWGDSCPVTPHGLTDNWVEAVASGVHCSKFPEAEAAVSVNKNKWLRMHVHVQLRLDALRAPPNPWLTVT